MRPHQECLLLAASFDGPPDEGSHPDRSSHAQTWQLRHFVRAVLARKSPVGGAVRDVELSGDQDILAAGAGRPEQRALLPVEPAQAMVAFDLVALLHAPHQPKHAVLPPLALARDMARLAAAADPMPLLMALQDGLRHSRAVAVFSDDGARDLALLGAGTLAALPLPALPPLWPDDPGRLLVCLFDHEPARGRSAALTASISAALPEAEVVTVLGAAMGAPPPHRGLHLHLAAASGVAGADDGRLPAGPSWRVVDSFAARCPVVLLRNGEAPDASAERLGMSVTPMRTGIPAATAAEAVAGLVRLAADAALVDVFRVQAGHAAEAFNRRIEDRMRALLP